MNSLGWNDWASKNKTVSKPSIHSSTDFRKNKPIADPKIPYLTDIIGIPLLGPIRAYYLLLLILFAFFLFTKSWLIGAFAGITMLFIVGWEFYYGSKTGGIKNELKETALAILLGLIVWFGSGFLLNTSTPINAIVSCSMLPAYERGDMVILQGAPANTIYAEYSGSKYDINSTASVQFGGQNYLFNGSIYSYCSQKTQASCANYYADPQKYGQSGGQISLVCDAGTESICKSFYSSPEKFVESHGPISFEYGNCNKYYPKTQSTVVEACVSKTYFNGNEIPFDSNAQLIVYQPKKSDVYSLVGDIVHRARVGINASDGTVYLTKGDNNPIYDFQFFSNAYNAGNSPVETSQLKGKVIFRIPWLGNFKLFITPQVLIASDQSTGCDSYFNK